MNTTGDVYAQGNSSQVQHAIELCQTYLSDLTSDDVILDLGCGTGEFTQYLAKTSGAKVTGIDKNDSLIQYARKHNQDANISYGTVDLQHPEWFQDSKRQDLYTTAVSFHVFHWIPDLKAVLQNIYKVLSPGGRLFVSQVFKPKNSSWKIIPKLTSKPKWQTLLDQINFTWESPVFRALYKDEDDEWIDDMASLQDLITSPGFSREFVAMDEIYLPANKATLRPLLPVLVCLSKEKQEEFMEEFLEEQNGKDIKFDMVTYMLTKNSCS